jgi:GT2 family glycosyltransferase
LKADVAIIIVTYNSARHIEACLRSVIEQRQKIRQEIIVVENASQDETADLIRRRFPSVVLLTPGRNLGFAAGVNLGARQADADFVLLLNPDTVVLDHAIDKLVAFARANPALGLYGGRTLKTNGALEPSSCWGLPSLWSLAMFASGLSLVARRNRIFDPESLGRWPRDSVREVGVITGCLLLVGISAWTKLRGLDERYFLYGEDTDFSMRARLAGFRPTIYPDAKIVHEVGQSSATPIEKLLPLYRGKTCFFLTHYSGLKLHLALALLQAGVGLRALLKNLAAIFHITTPRNDWSAIWHQRHQWIQGYPSDASRDRAN